MDKKKEARSNHHPLDDRAKKGLALYESAEAAHQATRAFNQRLSSSYPGSSKGRRLFRSLAIAATVLILLAVGSIMMTNNSAGESQWALQGNWKVAPQEPLAVVALAPNRSHTGDNEESLEVGRRAYQAGQFVEAAAAFSSYMDNTATPRPETPLFLGHAQLQFAPDLALITLEPFAKESMLDEYYRDLANWYLAWAHLQLDQPDLAREKLLQITEGQSPVYQDAQKLLKLLAKTSSESGAE